MSVLCEGESTVRRTNMPKATPVRRSCAIDWLGRTRVSVLLGGSGCFGRTGVSVLLGGAVGLDGQECPSYLVGAVGLDGQECPSYLVVGAEFFLVIR